MKISFLLPVLGLAGGLRVIACFAEELQRRGHEVIAIAPRNRWRRGLRATARSWLRGDGWRPFTDIEGGPNHFEGRPIQIRYIDRVRPFTDADLPDADVLVATWWETAEQAVSFSSFKGAKAYFIQQYEANFDQPEERVAATWRLPMQKIVCSRWLADLARDRFGDPTAVVAPNGIDLELFHAPPRGRRPRPTVGILYGSDPVKGFDVAWKALESVRGRLPDLEIHAISTSTPPPELAGDLACHFHRTPPQETLREIYANCDAWLVASRSEGFHLPPHEAMACRCPVVSTRVGGPMDMIVEGVNGYLVEPGDAAGLADRLLRVLESSPEDWLRMSDAALATATSYTWEEAVIPFERALAHALRDDQGGAPSGVPGPFKFSTAQDS
jgi:glycosyltransferase involved in cell wall biosynthesis